MIFKNDLSDIFLHKIIKIHQIIHQKNDINFQTFSNIK